MPLIKTKDIPKGERMPKRPVTCLRCGHVWTSTSFAPHCHKCGSSKIKWGEVIHGS
jgi:predicted Zn-ribbon and HTH transcriptional regulator